MGQLDPLQLHLAAPVEGLLLREPGAGLALLMASRRPSGLCSRCSSSSGGRRTEDGFSVSSSFACLPRAERRQGPRLATPPTGLGCSLGRWFLQELPGWGWQAAGGRCAHRVLRAPVFGKNPAGRGPGRLPSRRGPGGLVQWPGNRRPSFPPTRVPPAPPPGGLSPEQAQPLGEGLMGHRERLPTPRKPAVLCVFFKIKICFY